MVSGHIRELRRRYAGVLVEKLEGYGPFERARRRWCRHSSPNVRVIRSNRMRWAVHVIRMGERRGKCQLNCDVTRAEPRFRLSAKRTSQFKWAVRHFSRLLADEVCASAVVMVVIVDTPCSEVVSSVKSTGYPLYSPLSPLRPLPCVTTFQLDSTYRVLVGRPEGKNIL
jgi:hypothetical protein